MCTNSTTNWAQNEQMRDDDDVSTKQTNKQSTQQQQKRQKRSKWENQLLNSDWIAVVIDDVVFDADEMLDVAAIVVWWSFSLPRLFAARHARRQWYELDWFPTKATTTTTTNIIIIILFLCIYLHISILYYVCIWILFSMCARVHIITKTISHHLFRSSFNHICSMVCIRASLFTVR